MHGFEQECPARQAVPLGLYVHARGTRSQDEAEARVGQSHGDQQKYLWTVVVLRPDQ